MPRMRPGLPAVLCLRGYEAGEQRQFAAARRRQHRISETPNSTRPADRPPDHGHEAVPSPLFLS